MHAQHSGSAAPESAARSHRRVTSFRSRRSSLTDAQQEVWDRLWPVLGRLAVDKGDPTGDETVDVSPEPLDVAGWFGHPPTDLVLEIGCGTGTSTVAMAQTEPDIDVIAVEVYRRGLAHLLSGIDRNGVTNIRLIRGDGVDVLQHLLPSGSLTGVRVFFPDPWPKSRHHKRRLIQPDNVRLIADRLRPGGVLHVATDHAGYAAQIGEVGDAEPLLRRVLPGEAIPISTARPATKFELKARHAGSAVTEFLWVKSGGQP